MRSNYLNNKSFMAEIAKSKLNYCSFIDSDYTSYDEIVTSTDAMTDTTKVYRVMTYDHIPLDPDRKRRSRVTGEHHFKLPFQPFKHFAHRDGEWREVLRSHWVGGFTSSGTDLPNGHFACDHGRMTNTLGMMFFEMVTRYSMRGNFRNYSYRDEMVGDALAHLMDVGLQFDESRSDSAFSYITTIIKHAFTRRLNTEKKVQDIRDDLLIAAGMEPSNSRKNDIELRALGLKEPAPLKAKRGRPTKAEAEARKLHEA